MDPKSPLISKLADLSGDEAAAANHATPTLVGLPQRVSSSGRASSSGSADGLLPTGIDPAFLLRGGAPVNSSPGLTFPPDFAENPASFLQFDDELNFSNVIKIFVTRQKPDYGNPWLTSGISDTTGSGVVIQAGDRFFILTAAHVVADQTFLQVERSGNQDPNKYIASLYAICHDCDLALLTVSEDDGDFWDGLEPAPIAATPSLRSVVLVAGFPVGGEQMSITEGVVSRIEGQRYSHSSRRLLALTVDAAINSGNSGGPVFNVSGELVGIAFQVLYAASSNGHVIPPPIVRHFLDGVAKLGPKGYHGIPKFGLQIQELTNGNLRKHFRLDKGVHGVLVTKIVHGSSCDGFLQEDDVLTHIRGQPVANNGTVTYEGCGRIKIHTVFKMSQCGEQVPLRVIRKGHPMVVNVVAKPDHTLVARSAHDQWPMYFIYCGLVFQRLSMMFIDTQTPGFPHFERLVDGSKLMNKDWKEVCIVSRILSDEVNAGYEAERMEQIKKVNGKNVVDFASLVQMIESTETPYINLTTCCKETIILPSPCNPEAAEANKRIMGNYHVSVDRRL